MKLGSAYLASALAASTVMIAPASAQNTDWSKRVTQSATGGHVMGNPLAKHNLILNPIDLTAAMLARCGGRTKFFGNHRALLLQQPAWLKKFQSTSPEVMKTLNDGTVPQRMKKISKATGLDLLMKGRGFTAAKIDACLSDQAEQDKILAMTKYGTETLKLSGTPSFTIADKPLANVHSWTALQPKLAALPQ